MKPHTPAPGEVELDDADVPLPGLLLHAGGVIDAERVRSHGAEQRDGAVDESRREREEATEHGDGVARVEQRLGERGGDVFAGGGRGGGGRGERVEARVGAERGVADQQPREGRGRGEAAVERHGARCGSGGVGAKEKDGSGGRVYISGGGGFRVLGRAAAGLGLYAGRRCCGGARDGEGREKEVPWCCDLRAGAVRLCHAIKKFLHKILNKVYLQNFFTNEYNFT